jgi:hypothetical protein
VEEDHWFLPMLVGGMDVTLILDYLGCTVAASLLASQFLLLHLFLLFLSLFFLLPLPTSSACHP